MARRKQPSEFAESTNRRCHQRIVSWRVWHLDQHRWLWDGREFETRLAAAKAKIRATAGRRNPLTNWLRICARVVGIRADGTSPLRDAAQKEWDAKMKKPANVELKNAEPKAPCVPDVTEKPESVNRRFLQ